MAIEHNLMAPKTGPNFLMARAEITNTGDNPVSVGFQVDVSNLITEFNTTSSRPTSVDSGETKIVRFLVPLDVSPDEGDRSGSVSVMLGTDPDWFFGPYGDSDFLGYMTELDTWGGGVTVESPVRERTELTSFSGDIPPVAVNSGGIRAWPVNVVSDLDPYENLISKIRVVNTGSRTQKALLTPNWMENATTDFVIGQFLEPGQTAVFVVEGVPIGRHAVTEGQTDFGNIGWDVVNDTGQVSFLPALSANPEDFVGIEIPNANGGKTSASMEYFVWNKHRSSALEATFDITPGGEQVTHTLQPGTTNGESDTVEFNFDGISSEQNMDLCVDLANASWV